jgi:hypothetical protein
MIRKFYKAKNRSFLKKRTKKLLSIGFAPTMARAKPNGQSLFASFSSEKKDPTLPYTPSAFSQPGGVRTCPIHSRNSGAMLTDKPCNAHTTHIKGERITATQLDPISTRIIAGIP